MPPMPAEAADWAGRGKRAARGPMCCTAAEEERGGVVRDGGGLGRGVGPHPRAGHPGCSVPTPSTGTAAPHLSQRHSPHSFIEKKRSDRDRSDATRRDFFYRDEEERWDGSDGKRSADLLVRVSPLQLGWHLLRNIRAAIKEAKVVTNKPTLIKAVWPRTFTLAMEGSRHFNNSTVPPYQFIKPRFTNLPVGEKVPISLVGGGICLVVTVLTALAVHCYHRRWGNARACDVEAASASKVELSAARLVQLAASQARTHELEQELAAAQARTNTLQGQIGELEQRCHDFYGELRQERQRAKQDKDMLKQETARGTNVLRIVGYSLHKGLGVDRSIRSTTFPVGGYHWTIHYYPDGISSPLAPPGRLVLFLQLVSKKAEVRARFTFRLVDQATGKSTLFHRPWATPIASFSTMTMMRRERSEDAWGVFCVKKKSELEAYLRDDCLVIECDVTVIKEPRVNVTVRVPPSDLSGNLAKLLEGKKGADVTFRVGDELFPAHKIVLAMRSPVFDAEFYGPMREDDDDTASQCSIAIEDMQPAVRFQGAASLHIHGLDAVHGRVRRWRPQGDG
ncbi:unnamed protein product [Miscanthus lutarioriparius]|uniref:Uncharacterized protein n=1 Tax=Miscanthus lutarioriparius TaxID=422564 RepID=A0A811SEW3_9POAL|nr:unnamed protein product [Miscanthus lutarioriparius]